MLCAPDVVILSKLLVPPALVVKLLSEVVPPAAALKVVTPVLFKVKLWLPATVPFTAPVKVMSPLPVLTVVLPAKVVVLAAANVVLVSVYVPFKVNASLYVCAPVVVTFCRLVVPLALVVRLVNAVLAPAAALKVVAPVLFRVRPKAPSTAPVKVMAPLPVLTVVSVAKVVVPPTLKALLVVV